MNEYIQAFVTIVALVNPAICAQMFSDCTSNTPREQKTMVAIRSVATIGIILLIAAFAGVSILNIFGVSLDAFSSAGGGILIWIGASMIKSAQSSPHAELEESSKTSDSVTPLILFAASPGTITGVITVSASHQQRLIPVTAIVGVLATLFVLAVVLLLFAKFMQDRHKPSMVKKMITSYMGVIVVAMGVQFLLTGVKAFMS